MLNNNRKKMIAIIETGGKQYKVEKGTKFQIETMDLKEGDTFEVENVLLVDDNGKQKVGTPYLSDSKVTLKVLNKLRGDKIKVFKMKAKKRYQKTQGHRQELMEVEVQDIKL